MSTSITAALERMRLVKELKSNISTQPNPDKCKGAITHNLYWRRRDMLDTLFTNFLTCDAMCSGPEHSATGAGSGQPSYCILPLFHPPKRLEDPVNGPGYISNNGHLFDRRSPAMMQQAFHAVIRYRQNSHIPHTRYWLILLML
ncbi:hypothetical protein H4582DRAFT_2065213 [Lactarius indigo]|nr:hypothetical protein H4582DRAFT_2065213 [Lactarius indigo]